jgi:hypothetical protein
LIDLAIDGFDKGLQIQKGCGYIHVGFTSLPKKSRQVSLRIGIRNVRSAKANAMPRVNIENPANTPPKDCPDQDIGIEDKHLANGSLAAAAA